MKKIAMSVSLIATVSTILFGCSTAGPFVTNISSDGRGNLIIEKSMIKYDWWTGTISDVDNTTTKITVASPGK